MGTKIKSIILDVDGVVLGNLLGINTPMPHSDVLHKLRMLNKSGVQTLIKMGY